MRLRYRDEKKKETDRIIWPTIIGYAETVRLVAAWCELRRGFRHFRADRIVDAVFLDESIDMRPAELRARWKRHMAERGLRLPE